MTRFRVALAGIALLLVAAWVVRFDARRVGERDARIASLSADTLTMHRLADSLARSYRVDTVTLTRWRTRYDSLVDTVLTHLTDTLKIREFVYTSDSTINACTNALHTCEAGWALARARGDTLATLAHLTAKERPGFFSRFGCGPGIGATMSRDGRVNGGPAVACILKAWP